MGKAIGGSDNDEIYSLEQTKDGGYILGERGIHTNPKVK